MKKLFILMLALGAMACESGNKPYPSKTSAEHFDRAFEGDYKYGYANADMIFEHFYNEEYGYWGGFAQSTMCDADPANGLYENQYSAFNTTAASGDGFLLYYYDSYNDPCDIVCKTQFAVKSVKLNLTTYTYASITNEDINTFARAFSDGDYLKVIFTPLASDKSPAGDSVECYVVDYRDGKRFVATNWETFDLNLPVSARIRVTIETTDVGQWGANTPLYICLDDLRYEIL
jgi:hypothetical protein